MPTTKRTIKTSPSKGKLSRNAVQSVIKAVHVAPAKNDDAWLVQRTGPKRMRKTFESKDEALAFAKTLASRKPAEIIVHGRDGRIVRECEQKLTEVSR